MDFIEAYPNALPFDLCDRLIATINSHPGVFAGRTGNGLDKDKKLSRDLMLDSHPELADVKNEIINHTFERTIEYFCKYPLALIGAISVQAESDSGDLVTLTPNNFEKFGKPRIADIIRYLFRSGTINIQKYEKDSGGYFHWHSEQFPQAKHNEALHRVVLYMFYLNDVEEGGETEFYFQKKSFKPTKGTMIIAPAGFTHSHRGNMPKSEDKYIATSWIMFNRSEKLYSHT